MIVAVALDDLVDGAVEDAYGREAEAPGRRDGEDEEEGHSILPSARAMASVSRSSTRSAAVRGVR